MTMRRLLLTCLLTACAPGAPATEESARRDAAGDDTAFAAVQARGAAVMGVDQFTSTHLFTPLPDGGLIELQRDTTDPAGVAQVRAHMQDVATAFAAGDFRMPGLVHDEVVPGTDTMRLRREALHYSVEELPRGARVRIATSDSAALRAVHAFLAFQRMDHKAGMDHQAMQHGNRH